MAHKHRLTVEAQEGRARVERQLGQAWEAQLDLTAQVEDDGMTPGITARLLLSYS